MKIKNIIILILMLISLTSINIVLGLQGNGTETEPYEIYNCNDFLEMGSFTGSYFEQQNNIDFTSCNDNLTRPDFTGSRYYGQDYNITGYNSSSLALFSVLSNSYFYNVTLLNPIAIGNAPLIVSTYKGFGFFGLTTNGNVYFYDSHIINPYIYMDSNLNLFIGSFIGYNNNFYSTRFYYSSVRNISLDLRLTTTNNYLLIGSGFIGNRDSGTSAQQFTQCYATGIINTTRSNQPNLQYLSSFYGMVAVPNTYDLWSSVSFYSNYPYTRANGRKTTSSGTQTRTIYRGSHITTGWIFDSSDLINNFYDGELLNLSCVNETLLGDCLDSTNRNNVTIYNNSNYNFVTTWGVRNVTGDKSGEICLLWEDDCINVNQYEEIPPIPPYSLSGNGTEAEPFIIGNCTDLNFLRQLGDNLYFELSNDIDCIDTPNFTPFRTDYILNLNGNYHTIKNINIFNKTSSYSGLFTSIKNSRIYNLNFYNVTNNLNVEYSGILAGYTTNTCYFDNLTFNSCKVGLGVLGQRKGLVLGNNQDNIFNSIKIVNSSLRGSNYVGLFGGYASYEVIINNTLIINTSISATGSTTRGYFTGQLKETALHKPKIYSNNLIMSTYVDEFSKALNYTGYDGSENYLQVPNNFINLETTGNNGSEYYTTEQLKNTNLYLNANWDFVNVWGLREYNSIPCLLFEEGCELYTTFEAPPPVINISLLYPVNNNNYSSYDGSINVSFTINNNATCYLNEDSLGFLNLGAYITPYLSDFGNNSLNVSCFYNASIFDLKQVNFSMCIPDFVCSEYLECENDYENCINVTDSRSCGLNYTGLYSDFRVFCGVAPTPTFIQLNQTYDTSINIGKCPNNTGSILIYGIFLIFIMFIATIGFLKPNQLLIMVSGVLLILFGAVMLGCNSFIGWAIMLVGLAFISISLFGGKDF